MSEGVSFVDGLEFRAVERAGGLSSYGTVPVNAGSLHPKVPWPFNDDENSPAKVHRSQSV